MTVSKDGKAIVTDLKSMNIINTISVENLKRQLNLYRFSPNVSKLCEEKIVESLLKLNLFSQRTELKKCKNNT